MKNLLWNCTADNAPDLTVGQKFILKCSGPVTDINPESLQFKYKNLSDEVPTLSLLQTIQLSETGTELVVTSYRVGQHKIEDIVLTDGQTQIEIQGPSWKVNSILKQNPAQPPQPFPAFSMETLSYPIWFWIILLSAVVLLVLAPYFKFQSYKKLKQAYDDLKNLETALSPSDSFFKEMRKLEKNFELDLVSAMDFLAQSQKFFLIYLSRKLKIPFHLLPVKKSLKELRRRHFRIFRDCGKDLENYFSELSKSQQSFQKKDAKYLIQNTQRIIEEIEDHFEKSERTNKSNRVGRA